MEEKIPMSHLNHKLRQRVAVTAALSLACAALAAPRVSAQSASSPVPVNGTVTNSNVNAPLIECAWALPDPNLNWGDLMNGYVTPGGAVANDDQPAVKPATPPCLNSNVGQDGSKPSQADQPSVATAPIHIQVAPNIDDKPTLRWIELWSAVDSTADGTIVHWKVYHPDGSFKVQVDGWNFTRGSSQAGCTGPTGMFSMAIATGQLDAASVRNNTPQVHDSLEDYCRQNVKDFYYGAFGLSKHQPYGRYRVEATAIKPANGGESTLNYWIEVLPVMSLAKDFTGLAFPTLAAGNVYNIDGDTNWGSPAPTLQNQGNAGLTVEMSYTNLCLVVGVPPVRDCGPGKRINHFDGGLGTSINTVEHRDPIPSADTDAAAIAGPSQGFLDPIDTGTSPRYRTLCPNDLAKVDFSIHTPLTLQKGDYAGNVHLKVVASPLCPTDRGSVYGPPFTDPNVTVDTTFDGTTPKATSYLGP